MGTPGLPLELLQAAVRALEIHNHYQRAADSLGLNLSTFRSRISTARTMGIVPAHEPEPIEHRDILKLRRLTDDNAGLKRHILKLERELNEKEDFRKAAFGLADSEVNRAQIECPSEKPHSSIDIPLLMTSDFQYGEVVMADEMDGLNAYSPAIAHTRFDRLIKAASSLISTHVNKPAYPALYYCRLGDSISGRIHDELAESNGLSDVECVNDLVGMESDGINAMYKAAKAATKQRSIKIRVISIPGNHGRVTKKPRSKGYVRHNLETLLAWQIEREFKNVPDIEFITPMSGDVYEKIYNTNFLFSHGDRLGSRGGTGFIGAAATILRGVHKTRQQYAGIGKYVDYVALGHYHTSMFLPHAVVNNNLCGFNEYARDLRFEAAPPSQNLIFVHPRFGITIRREIILEENTADGRPWHSFNS